MNADDAPSAPAEGAPSDTNEHVERMKSTAARGAGWAIGIGLVARVISLVGSIAITHMIDPDVMGEVGVAVIVVTMMNTFSTIGYGHYMLSRPKEGKDTIWHITVLHMVIGVVVLGLLLPFNGLLAEWMKAPALPRYLPWLVLVGLLDRMLFVPERVLIRGMQLKRVAITRSLGELGYMGSAIVLVALGFGGFAVVLANVVRSGLKLVMFVASAPRAEWLTPHRLSYAKMKEILAFGAPLAFGGAVYFAAARWDNLIISMLYGPAMMGQYNVAYNLAALPAEQIGEQAEEALLPSLARVESRDRPPLLLYSTGIMSFIIFPVSIGLGMISTTAAATFIGPKWEEVGAMMTILCVLSISRPLSNQVHAYMLAENRPRILLAVEVGKLAAVVGLLLTLGRLSPRWACVAVGIAFLGAATAAQWIAARNGKFPLRAFFVKTSRPFLACVPLVAGVLAARWAVSGVHVRGVGLAAEVVAGGIGYVLGALVVARPMVNELIGLVKNRRRKPAVVA